MKGLIWAVMAIIIIVILVLVFSGGDSQNLDTENIASVATENAIDDLKSSGLVAVDVAVEVRKIEDKEWPDACLGISELETLCAEVITPGFEITLKADDHTFIYRTNKMGDLVVLAEQK